MDERSRKMLDALATPRSDKTVRGLIDTLQRLLDLSGVEDMPIRNENFSLTVVDEAAYERFGKGGPFSAFPERPVLEIQTDD